MSSSKRSFDDTQTMFPEMFPDDSPPGLSDSEDEMPLIIDESPPSPPSGPPPKKARKDPVREFISEFPNTSDESEPEAAPIPKAVRRKAITRKRNLQKKKVEKIRKRIRLENQLKPSKENNAYQRQMSLCWRRMTMEHHCIIEGRVVAKPSWTEPEIEARKVKIFNELKYGKLAELCANTIRDEERGIKDYMAAFKAAKVAAAAKSAEIAAEVKAATPVIIPADEAKTAPKVKKATKKASKKTSKKEKKQQK